MDFHLFEFLCLFGIAFDFVLSGGKEVFLALDRGCDLVVSGKR